jgi:hypothetical protein
MSAQKIQIPERLTRRPRYNGMIVPYFVSWFKDGHQCNENTEGAKPSFPVTDYSRLVVCRKQNRCWICGQPMGAYKAFVFGPASAIARSSYEPPSHRDCARYAMQVCPYLINPKHTHITEKGYVPKPGEVVLPDVQPGNPGLGVIWITRGYGIEHRDPSRAVCIFTPEEPVYVELWKEGRKATYKEAAEAINKAVVDNKMMEHGNQRELAWRVGQLLKYADAPAD